MTMITADEPIYLFQMGKVGSASLHSTLLECLPNKTLHKHCFEEMTPEDQQELRRRQRENQPVTVITPIREPLARNISGFFQTFKRDTGIEMAEHKWEIAELLALFLSRYPHHESLGWFDVDFRPAMGIDVYAQPFPKQRQWQVYAQGSTRVLVYRSDLGREQQLAIVSDFLGHKIKKWIYTNRAEDKDYAELYKEFCSIVKLPDDYIARLSESRYFRHFWTGEEILAYAGKWRARTDHPPATPEKT